MDLKQVGFDSFTVNFFVLNDINLRWLGVRLELIGNFIVVFASLFAVVDREIIDPGLAGLSITYALTVNLEIDSLYR